MLKQILVPDRVRRLPPSDWSWIDRRFLRDFSSKLSGDAVLCYSRMCYIEFTLSQRKAEFYRCLSNALEFFGGSPRKVIFDNLKAAVISGSGREATLHPAFLALCGHYCLEPIACTARDPSKYDRLMRDED